MKKKIHYPSFSIILPFYNEEENLRILIPKILKVLKKIKNSYKIILVDDLSTDRSLQVCKILAKYKKQIKIYKLKKKGGQTGAIKTGVSKNSSKYSIFMDSDLQDDPIYLSKFVKKINLGLDLVVGKRIARNPPFIIIIATKIYDLMMELFFKKKIQTYRSPFIAAKSSFFKKLPWNKNDHRYLVPISIYKGAANFGSVNYVLRNRKHGASNYNTRLKVIPGFFEVAILLLRFYLKLY
jgi:glycosyltransferase involved in cell wall biosynthesis